MKKISILLLLSIAHMGLSAQKYNFTTYSYYENDSVSLDLDLFLPDSAPGPYSLVIFMHGGGFSNGTRTNGHPFCQFLADSGVASATISYTLYMKGKNFSCEGQLSEKIKAIQMAAFQARVATNWFLDRADEFDIDTGNIFLAGSSAGAEAVLQAVYWDTTVVNFFPDTLSPCFKYAGVISGAGALLDIGMINESTKIPTICFHGTCDPLVPYYMAPHHYCSQISPGYMMMFGGLAIYERLLDLNESCQLMSYCGEGHEHAGTPFYGPGTFDVLEFIQGSVRHQKFNIHKVFNNGEDCSLSLDFVHCFDGSTDYSN